ncbi:MAG TPA: homocysteine S-methyltransferase [Solirubrobacteraceae bacterium]
MPHRVDAQALTTLLTLGDPVVLDGGLATQLEEDGHDLSDDLWSARLLADDPAAIEDAHLAFLRAGARVVTSASYQASRAGYERVGVTADRADRLLQRSVLLAQAARARFEAEAPGAPRALVAASVGPYGAVLAGGQEYTGDYGGRSGADLERFHEERLAALLQARPDCVACETIPRADEAAALARVLDRLQAPQAWVTFACRDGRTTVHGEPIEEAVRAALGGTRVAAVGVNCTAPEHVEELLQRARSVTDVPLVAYPNSGRVWDGEARTWTRAGIACFPAALVRGWVAAGARLVGGCCGIGPAGIAQLAPALAGAA